MVAHVRKGGIITYVRHDLLAGLTVSEVGSIGNIEYLVINITVLNVVLITIYRPPTALSSDFKSVLQIIRSSMEGSALPPPQIVLTGDLNFPTLNWVTRNIASCASETREQAQLLLSFFEDFFLEQFVEEATRPNNILDIFAVNDSELIANIVIENTDRKTSDHKFILVKTTICLTSGSESCAIASENVLSKLEFWCPEIQWDLVKQELGTHDWGNVLINNNIDPSTANLLKVIEDICVKYVPPKVIKNRNIIPRDRRVLMRQRRKLRTKLLQTRNPLRLASIEAKLSKIEKDMIDSHEEQHSREEEKAVQKINADPKYFYNYARSKSKVKTPIGPLQCNNTTITDPKAIAELLKNQFESVFSIPTEGMDIEDILKDQGPRCLEDILFTEGDIEASILEIPPNSSPGLDAVPALFLQKCARELRRPLYLLWRMSLDIGKLPKCMKTGVVTPVFKGGNRCLPENYRPISLTSHLCKLFERLIVKKAHILP